MLNVHVGKPPLTPYETAKLMGVSPDTVKFYRLEINKKLGTGSIIEVSHKLGWILPDSIPSLRPSYCRVLKILHRNPTISNADIAKELSIRQSTVWLYLSEMYKLYDVYSRLELFHALGWYHPQEIPLSVAS
jgi:DNA-binding CsgD family transcriptional regulator